MKDIEGIIKNLESMGAINRHNGHITEADAWDGMAAAVLELYDVSTDILHQLSTDSDLDTIAGADKYKRLVKRLQEVTA